MKTIKHEHVENTALTLDIGLLVGVSNGRVSLLALDRLPELFDPR
jgi:hypothetical protein